MKDRPSRRRAFKLMAVLIGLILALGIGELICTVLAYVACGTSSVAELHKAEKSNNFITALMEQVQCDSYLRTLYPHPYLGFVHCKQGGGDSVNNIGLLGGRDLPLRRDPSKFTILVTGGSVAAQFAQIGKDGPHYLEDILNQRYDFGPKRVVVLNGADGAWKQPQQAIMLLLYGDAVDAVCSLDGFNEVLAMENHSRRLEYPASSFHTVNPIVQGGQEQLAAASLSNALYGWSSRNWVVSHSRLAYYTTKWLRGRLVRWVQKQAPRAKKEDTSVESLFALPEDWSQEERDQFSRDQYKKYILMMDCMARRMDLKAAFFLQPVPAVGKKLTAEEKAVVGRTDYGEGYSKLVQEILELRRQQVPVFSLLDAFDNCEETLYADPIHCKRDGPGHGSRGYSILAERIAKELEREWGLKPKTAAAPSSRPGAA